MWLVRGFPKLCHSKTEWMAIRDVNWKDENITRNLIITSEESTVIIVWSVQKCIYLRRNLPMNLMYIIQYAISCTLICNSFHLGNSQENLKSYRILVVTLVSHVWNSEKCLPFLYNSLHYTHFLLLLVLSFNMFDTTIIKYNLHMQLFWYNPQDEKAKTSRSNAVSSLMIVHI